MIWHCIFQTEAAEPVVIGQIEIYFLTQPALGAYAIAVSKDQPHGINGRPASVAVVIGAMVPKVG